MPKITVDGKTIEAKDRQMILQACGDANIPVPQYCYHPGLSIPASCRICLVEVEGIPKLVPPCQTPVRDGMVVLSKSSKAIANQKQVMEYLLINHPLDCPVCDQAGECFLQDYSYEYGRSQSRFEEDKVKHPKKDVGEKIYLYADRCIMCTRCVRFTREVSGTSELYVEAGETRKRSIFSPAGRATTSWRGMWSICVRSEPCSTRISSSSSGSGCSRAPVDQPGRQRRREHLAGIQRRRRLSHQAALQPRDQSLVDQRRHRYSYKAMQNEKRLRRHRRKQYGGQIDTIFDVALEQATSELKSLVSNNGTGSLYAMLSPMMACEEAWLLGTAIRKMDPQAVLILGPVPTAAAR